MAKHIKIAKPLKDVAYMEQNNSTIFLVHNHDKSEQAILSMLSAPKC